MAFTGCRKEQYAHKRAVSCAPDASDALSPQFVDAAGLWAVRVADKGEGGGGARGAGRTMTRNPRR
eukprot:gene13953-22101_t